jgi:hypothetical protein
MLKQKKTMTIMDANDFIPCTAGRRSENPDVGAPCFILG